MTTTAQISTVLLAMLTTQVFAADSDSWHSNSWHQWRGPNRDGSIQTEAWPKTVSAGGLVKQVEIPLGESYSGPIVVGELVFTTETKGDTESVIAINRNSGQEVWKTSWKGKMTVPFFAASNGSWIRSTPAWHNNQLFVASMEDVLYCLNSTDGKIVWQKDIRKEFGTANQSFGFVCSPLVLDNHVFTQTSAGLLKIDCDTGETAFRTLNESGGMMAGAFSSPVVATIAGVRQLVVQTRKALTGVSVENGTVLWTQDIPAFRGMNILTPTIIGDSIFTSSYGGGSFLFDIARTDDTFTVKQRWKAKAEGYMSSAVQVDGQLYLHLRNQRFTSINVADGQSAWTTKPFGKYWSMVVNGKSALALDEKGILLLLNLNQKEFQEVDRLKVSDQETWAHLAVSKNQIFIRDLKGLTIWQIQ